MSRQSASYQKLWGEVHDCQIRTGLAIEHLPMFAIRRDNALNRIQKAERAVKEDTGLEELERKWLLAKLWACRGICRAGINAKSSRDWEEAVRNFAKATELTPGGGGPELGVTYMEFLGLMNHNIAVALLAQYCHGNLRSDLLVRVQRFLTHAEERLRGKNPSATIICRDTQKIVATLQKTPTALPSGRRGGSTDRWNIEDILGKLIIPIL